MPNTEETKGRRQIKKVRKNDADISHFLPQTKLKAPKPKKTYNYFRASLTLNEEWGEFFEYKKAEAFKKTKTTELIADAIYEKYGAEFKEWRDKNE